MKEPNHDITPQEQMAEAMQAERPGGSATGRPKEEKPSLWIECYTLLHDLVYILVFVTILFVFALRVVSVSGPSMYPTLVDRDYVALLSNVFYSGSDIQNGDVVVALAPRFDDEPIVKRVIATAGQTVDIDFTRGIVYVDGAALDEPYINEPTHLQFDSRGCHLSPHGGGGPCVPHGRQPEQFLRQPAGVHWPGGYPVYSGKVLL